ncbi:MAG: YtxH domain-containing protein [Acidobacteria bacterium]|nr:YtxH domain-containing protein [Acidobacteriota bacterium]MBI3487203.1 YtxH domain-containing protein [Acidobacteriota bacterium]
MSQPQRSPTATSILIFLAGAALGAVVLALTTPKTGPRLRAELKRLAGRGRHRARMALAGFRGTSDRSKRRFVWKKPDPGRSFSVSVDDLPG